MTPAAPDRPGADSVGVAIVGGGLAGAALAALLARQGRPPALFEREFFPRDKLCGEFLSARSRLALGRIGCLESVLALSPPRIVGGRFFAASGRCAAVRLAGEALGVSRRALDEIVLRRAEAAGARVFEGALVRRIAAGGAGAVLEVERRGRDSSSAGVSTVRAGLVVAAYGRRAELDRQLDRPFLKKSHPFVGLKRHHVPKQTARGRGVAADLAGWVEIHLFEGGYCGLNSVEGGRVNVCALLRREMLAGLGSNRWDSVCAAMASRSASLRGRLEGLEACQEDVQSVAHVPLEAKETHQGGVVFLGDAAAMIAPLCGDGQGMALESAELLAELLGGADGEERGPGLGPLWDRAWTRRFAGRLAWGRRLQAILLRPGLGEAAVAAVRLCPPLGAALVDATRGRAA